ncbi:GTP cyclohydrolase, FolE2/MptA family [Kamptonema sp. UHCC 0994]|uniref:GTP cyclohydrolase, FolE2/MptA family n=1 Tax=Kamptonema sp. UHCC 0994 TaxID=3031329 RepID=UPI0023B8B1DB|nr:GTP cyclohydrolase, FolE2/MptA family [Kamptonema sp. UHCC 0994]MDF0552319.1 GTP cyclohydrolase, FolE2/MptA family [Kamptonema sp. UHCC 0994]
MPHDLELLTVYRAHRKPQFLEDALRDLLKSLYTELQDQPECAKVHIQSLSMESIHDFDLDGAIEYSIGELNQIFSNK